MELDFVEIDWQTDRYEEEIRLRDKLLRQPLGLSFTPADLESERQHLHFGMVKANALVACLVVVPLTASLAKLRQMCVDQSFQRTGIGSKLIQCTESELLGRGFETVELNARDIAVGFYERLGYRQIGGAFLEVTIPHVRMTKRLNSEP